MTRTLFRLAIEFAGFSLIGWAIAGWKGVIFACGVELIAVAVLLRIGKGGGE